MLNLIDIVKANSNTFYNYRTGRPVSSVPRYLLVILIAGIMALFYNRPATDLYSSFIAAQAILVGFSFNVLVYLASANMLVPVDPDIIEDNAKAKKLNVLSSEIFSNLSYFNIVSLTSISLSLLLIGGNAFSFDVAFAKPWLDPDKANMVLGWGAFAKHVFRVLLIFLTYATVVEALATFVRVTKRVTYFFVEKRKLAG